MEIKRVLLVLGFLGILFGCAGFSYQFYGLSQVIYDQGTLTGPTEKEDLPFSKCAPNSQTKNPCIVIFSKDFFALKQDYEDTQQKLKECEKGK